MHTWQDTVLAVCILAFNLALIPTIFNKSKPAFSTSVLTLISSLATVVVYVNLSLWYSAVMSSINASLWLVLAIQKLAAHRKQ